MDFPRSQRVACYPDDWVSLKPQTRCLTLTWTQQGLDFIPSISTLCPWL